MDQNYNSTDKSDCTCHSFPSYGLYQLTSNGCINLHHCRTGIPTAPKCRVKDITVIKDAVTSVKVNEQTIFSVSRCSVFYTSNTSVRLKRATYKTNG